MNQSMNQSKIVVTKTFDEPRQRSYTLTPVRVCVCVRERERERESMPHSTFPSHFQSIKIKLFSI